MGLAWLRKVIMAVAAIIMETMQEALFMIE